MLTVRLYGDLGARFGRRFVLDVKNPAEAVHALCTQLQGLRAYLIEHGAQKFRVRGLQDYDETDLHYPQSSGTLKIVPLVQGAGAWGKIIAGIGLVAASFIPGVNVAVAGIMLSIGASLAMGGIAQLIAPRNATTGATPEKADNQPSLAFDGAVNTMGQGGPVPLGYGRLRVGSQIISVGFSTNNEVVIR